MVTSAENPLIVQSDATVLLEVHSPRAGVARAALAPFAELIKSPEHVHTYRLTPLSIWNARATGVTAQRSSRPTEICSSPSRGTRTRFSQTRNPNRTLASPKRPIQTQAKQFESCSARQ